jgi:rhodanese-related sulfurtransferase
MKKILLIVLVAFILIGCEDKGKSSNVSSNLNNTAIKSIDCNTAKDYSTRANHFLIDVRTKEEYDSYHMENAINIPLDNINKILEDINIKKSSVIIVYCKSGVRSSSAAEKLVSLGYKNVYDLGSVTKCN